MKVHTRNFAKNYTIRKKENCTSLKLQDVLTTNNCRLKSTKTNFSLLRTKDHLNMEKYRLPKQIKPLTYELFLFPNLSTGLFTGRIIIKVHVKEEAKEILLNANNLSVKSAFYEHEQICYELDKKHELLILKPCVSVLPGERSIEIEFEGETRNKIVGLYSSSYKDLKGDKHFIATSKFEPTYARQAFPCFDEPNMKATFKVHLLKPKDKEYIALSNMPQESEKCKDDGVLVTFQESVKMSTYLSCFIICDFKCTSDFINPESDNIPFNVYATPFQLDKTTFARNTGKKVMEYFIQYFGIKYPLPKLDLIAIPDFVSGAMEHWGLVTFRETALLFDENLNSTLNQERVATTVSHELAHSWFGNLVTMNWWNDLWLNEGFASYIEKKGLNYVYEDWNMLDKFLIRTLHPVMSIDSTPASHPIVKEVVSPDQITELFDAITYSKGASILRMLEFAIGEDVFRKATMNYLNKYKYGNAVTQQYWDEIQKIIGDSRNITEMMNTWTIQMGYPVVSVTNKEDTYILKQKLFLKRPDNRSDMKCSPYNYKWTIPITYVTDISCPTLVWFDHDKEYITIKKPEGSKWIKFNLDQVGYYRVNYEIADWNKLSENILKFSVSNRAHLIDDSFCLAQSGEIPYAVPLSLIKYLKEESDYVPWSVASSKILMLKNFLNRSEHYSLFRNFILKLLENAVKTLTWNQKSCDRNSEKLTRSVVLNLACTLQDEQCLREANTKFNLWLNSGRQVPPDLRNLVYTFGIKNASDEDWKKLLDKYLKETDPNEKQKLVNGLTSTKNPDLLKKLIELADDESYVRKQDYLNLLIYISDNEIGQAIVWDFVRGNWSRLVERFTLNDRYLGSLIPSITSKFNSNVQLSEMETFFGEYPDAGAGEAARKRAVENVKNNIYWIDKHKVDVEKWILNNCK